MAAGFDGKTVKDPFRPDSQGMPEPWCIRARGTYTGTTSASAAACPDGLAWTRRCSKVAVSTGALPQYVARAQTHFHTHVYSTATGFSSDEKTIKDLL